MRIGIAGPVEIASISKFLPNLTPEEKKLGLGGTAVNLLIEGFLKDGHSVTVFTLDPSIKDRYVIESERIKILIGGFRVLNKSKWFDFCRKEYKSIQKFILEEKNSLDIVNAHWSYEFAIGAILADVPHLITFRDHSPTILKLTKHPYRLTRLLMDFWVRKRGKHFSYNSAYLKNLIKIKGVVIPNPIRESEIEPSGKFAAGKKVYKICFIANGWDYRKNPETALKAFAVLQQTMPETELYMIGKGYNATGKKYDEICKAGLNKNVHFIGSLQHPELMHRLKEFDVLLHTAREESFGNNLIEAMAKGIPVIAGKHAGAVPWVLDNGNSGCLTDIENPNQVANDLKHLLTDTSYYKQLSEAGIASLKARFALTTVCKQYLNVYQTIIDGKE